MTGIGGLLFEPAPTGASSRWKKLVRRIRREYLLPRGPNRFVVLCFRRTGSNWLCGMLFNHPQILMHNEIFNENGVHTYYKVDVLRHNWDYEGRDVNPEGFVEFMLDCSKFSKFRDSPRGCKAAGYKSFPNHYLQHGVPLAAMDKVYHDKILLNPDVKKIILQREDIVRTYISSRRAFETGIYMTRNYEDHRVHIDLKDMQRFIDRYNDSYDQYLKDTRGHPRCLVTYEELCRDTENAMSRIWHLLGVKQMDPVSLAECHPQSSPDSPLIDSIENYSEVEFAYRHDPNLSKYFHDSGDDNDSTSPSKCASYILKELSFEKVDFFDQPSSKNEFKWVLLVPVRAANRDDQASCRERLCHFRDSVIRTTEKNKLPDLLFGVDDDDLIYRDGTLLESIFLPHFRIHVLMLSGLQGKICKIWRRLAAHAYTTLEADFTCLLGDDIEIENGNWQESIQTHFASIARTKKLPFGAACIAFNDKSFPGFPTFPVIHKWHFHAFGGSILPSQFDNQGGDPFLFELYKRFGSANFAVECCLKNSIGGKGDARYTKQRLRFEDDILTTAIRKIACQLEGEGCSGSITRCVDVVVPTYRCDIEGLQRIVQLRATWPVQVSFWLVLDNPGHPQAPQVRAMQNVKQNFQVNVLEQFDRSGNALNLGASAARNFGLGHSKADSAILLDDDVIPDEQLIDAYLGAMMRWPNASVLVGSTSFPPAHNILTQAIVASDIPGAFTVADRTRNPPWGVTANICVRARTSRVRFDLSYPKTGGGEDLDFCARAQRHGPIKAVPGAKARHPWWYNGKSKAISQILGWAEGEVKCIGKPCLRKHIFFSAPNGVEFVAISFCLLPALSVYLELPISMIGTKIALFSLVVVFWETIWHASGIRSWRLRGKGRNNRAYANCLRVLAAWLIMLQEITRFARALQHSFTWLFWRVDWHFGQNPSWVVKKKRDTLFRSLVYSILFCIMVLEWDLWGRCWSSMPSTHQLRDEL